MSYQKKNTRGKGVPFHQTLKFTADIKVPHKEACDVCAKKFTPSATVFVYGSCKISLCRACYLKKLE